MVVAVGHNNTSLHALASAGLLLQALHKQKYKMRQKTEAESEPCEQPSAAEAAVVNSEEAAVEAAVEAAGDGSPISAEDDMLSNDQPMQIEEALASAVALTAAATNCRQSTTAASLQLAAMHDHDGSSLQGMAPSAANRDPQIALRAEHKRAKTSKQ